MPRNNSKERREWRKLGAIERAEKPARQFPCCPDKTTLSWDVHQQRAHGLPPRAAS